MTKQEQMVEVAKRFVEYNEENLVAEFERIADLLKRTTRDVERYIEKIKNGDDEIIGTTQEDQAGWAINALENMIRNLNFSRVTAKILGLGMAKQSLKRQRMKCND